MNIKYFQIYYNFLLKSLPIILNKILINEKTILLYNRFISFFLCI